MQLLDELSMIYMTCISFYVMYSFNQPRMVRLFVFVFITSVAVFVTGYYHYLKDPSFHQKTFTLLAAVVILKKMYETEILLRPARRAKPQDLRKNGTTPTPEDEKEQARIDKRDAGILEQMWFMAMCGLISVGLGFLIWTLDKNYCNVFRRWRRQLGLPWGILLEGHGWW
jgi:dihydroceramidase